MPHRKPLITRLMTHVNKSGSGCWLWEGRLNPGGYGQIKSGGKNGRTLMVHRVSYEHHVGPIPEGLTIDHLCRVRNCVNPAHLEPVTRAVNTLRSFAPAAINARLTHCKKAGHPLTPDNLTYDTPGHRRCKKCRREYDVARDARRRAERQARRAAA